MNAESDDRAGRGPSRAFSLKNLDVTLEEFASTHGFALERIDSDSPRRVFRCDGTIDRFIQIHFDGDNDGKWYVWICVSEEGEQGRYRKRRNLKGPVTIAELQYDLAGLLASALDEVLSWSGTNDDRGVS